MEDEGMRELNLWLVWHMKLLQMQHRDVAPPPRGPHANITVRPSDVFCRVGGREWGIPGLGTDSDSVPCPGAGAGTGTGAG